MAAAEHGYVVYQRGEDGESDAWDDTVLIKAYDSAVSAMKAKLAEQHPEFAAAQAGTKTKKKRNKSKSKKKKSGGTVKWKSGDSCRAIYTDDGEIYEARILSIDDDAEICTVQYVDYGNEEDHLLSNLLPLATGEESSQDVKTDTASDTGSLHQASTVQEVSSGKHRNKKSSSGQQQSAHSKRRTPKWPWNGYAPPPLFTQMPPRPQNFPAYQPPHFTGYHAACPPTSATQFPGYPTGGPPTSATHFPGYQAAGPNAPPPPVFPCVPPPPPLFTDQGEENEALYSMLISWYMSGYHTGYYQGLKHSTASATAASGHGIPR